LPMGARGNHQRRRVQDRRRGMTEEDSRSKASVQNLGQMSEPAEQPPATLDAPGAELNAPARRALREARREAVVVLAVDVALLGGLASIDKAKGWGILDLPWWAWLLLA